MVTASTSTKKLLEYNDIDITDIDAKYDVSFGGDGEV